MGFKEEKVVAINKALKKSKVARSWKVRADILPSGSIEYSKELTTSLGRKYRARIPFSEVLAYLWGEDARELKKKYGRKTSRR